MPNTPTFWPRSVFWDTWKVDHPQGDTCMYIRRRHRLERAGAASRRRPPELERRGGAARPPPAFCISARSHAARTLVPVLPHLLPM